jgi:hypothetical protein
MGLVQILMYCKRLQRVHIMWLLAVMHASLWRYKATNITSNMLGTATQTSFVRRQEHQHAEAVQRQWANKGSGCVLLDTHRWVTP